MPNTRNAKKDLRKNRRRRARNRAQRSALRTLVKKAKREATAGDPQQAETTFRTVVKRLDQAAAKKLIHKNKAARIKSHLAKMQPSAGREPEE